MLSDEEIRKLEKERAEIREPSFDERNLNALGRHMNIENVINNLAESFIRLSVQWFPAATEKESIEAAFRELNDHFADKPKT